MTVGSEFADDLKHELLTEMAESFFSRRRRLDERLENFAVLRERVARRGGFALARWRAFRRLLLGAPETDAFLTGLGFDVPALLAQPATTEVPCATGRPLALTRTGRYRKAVLAAYQNLRRTLEDYNEGGYAPDPREPRRMGRIPGYDHLLATGEAINAEIAAVNACRSPSDMLQFTKSLDPARLEQEYACPGLPPDGASLDRDLAYAPLVLDALGAPRLPTPPPPEEAAAALGDLADRLFAADPQACLAALKP